MLVLACISVAVTVTLVQCSRGLQNAAPKHPRYQQLLRSWELQAPEKRNHDNYDRKVGQDISYRDVGPKCPLSPLVSQHPGTDSEVHCLGSYHLKTLSIDIVPRFR